LNEYRDVMSDSSETSTVSQRSTTVSFEILITYKSLFSAFAWWCNGYGVRLVIEWSWVLHTHIFVRNNFDKMQSKQCKIIY